MLNIEGRRLVINSEVGGIINYYLQLIPLSKGVVNKMEKISRYFFAGIFGDKKKNTLGILRKVEED